jgi:hypothetical protein
MNHLPQLPLETKRAYLWEPHASNAQLRVGVKMCQIEKYQVIKKAK